MDMPDGQNVPDIGCDYRDWYGHYSNTIDVDHNVEHFRI